MDAASANLRGRFPQLAKYEVLEELGHGGMATVYRARDRRLGREVAVKVIHPHLRDSPEVVTRFHTEARTVAKLRHPNIVEVFDVGDADDAEVYLVVELLRGTTLRKLLQERRAMPPEVAAALALELLGGLAHAHANGVVHRDVKPENVLIELKPGDADTPGAVLVKLTDFGIAKLLDAQGVTSTGQVLGSPAHMAPEQIEGGEVDGRADVFGMGVLLYECMVGHLPFEGNNPAQVLRRVLDGHYPEAQRERALVGNRWSAILDRALARTPDARFPEAVAMRDAIAAELARLGIASPSGEVAAWLADPAAFEARHAKRLIETLCTLGNEERKAGAVLQAAADYNRALAHAPDDPQLLRFVAAMHRDEARARLLRRAAVVLFASLGLAAGVLGVVRVVAHRAPQASLEAARALSPHGSEAQGAPASPAAAISASPAHPESASPTARPRAPAPPAPARETAPKVTERTISLDLQPGMGVKISVDDGPPSDVVSGKQLTFDTKAHALTFTCEVCTAKEVPLAEGDKDSNLRVSLSIKPATLIVQGDVDKTYQIVEEPQLVIRAGSNSVAMKSMYGLVRVRQMETDALRTVRLQAGKMVTVSF